jgi:hypothetical protein
MKDLCLVEYIDNYGKKVNKIHIKSKIIHWVSSKKSL